MLYRTIMTSETRDMATVPRWCIIRTIRQQNLAEHSYFVTLALYDLMEHIAEKAPSFYPAPIARAELLKLAMLHDYSETITGDITGPVKSQILDPEKTAAFIFEQENARLGFSPTASIAALPPEQKFMLKIADWLESALFLRDEIKLGNHGVTRLYESHTDAMFRYMSDSDLDELFRRHVRGYVEITLYLNTEDSMIYKYPGRKARAAAE